MRKSEIWEFLWVSMNGLQRHSIFFSTWGIGCAVVFLFFCSVLLCCCFYVLFCFVLSVNDSVKFFIAMLFSAAVLDSVLF